MTTAHRPTWKAAVGRGDEGGWSSGGAISTAISVKDVASHTKLKTRKGSQIVDRREALQKSLEQLEQAVAKSSSTKRKGHSHHKLLMASRPALDEKVEEEAKVKLLKQTAEVDDVKLKQKYDDSDVDDDSSASSASGDDDGSDSDSDDDSKGPDGGGTTKKKSKIKDADPATEKKSKKGGDDAEEDDEEEEESDLDASDSSSSSSSDDSDDDDDDEAALQAELAKIRAEREQARLKAEQQAQAVENAKLEEAALLGNPLLNTGAGASAVSAPDAFSTNTKKRGWNDDVVFRNQAKNEPQPKKRFINDTVRNDFHRRFLNKFIR